MHTIEQEERDSFQQYYHLISSGENKVDALCRILQSPIVKNMKTILIFCRSTKNAGHVVDVMREKNVMPNVDIVLLHTDMIQSDRKALIEGFMKTISDPAAEEEDSRVHIIVTNILFARSFDLRRIPLIIHYDMPNSFESYPMQMGQSCSYRRVIINCIADDRDQRVLSDLQTHFHMVFNEL